LTEELSETGDSFGWRVRPFEKEPVKVIVVIVAAVSAFGVGTLLMGQIVLGFLGFAMILGTPAEYWMVTTYRITAQEASSRTGLSLSAITWADVKRVIPDSNGVRLSPLEAPSWRDAFRGVFLKFGDQQAKVEELVGRFGPQ